MLFSTQIGGHQRSDLLFTVFEVPTVCFCRREQKDRAHAKLGVPFRASDAVATVKAEPSERKVRAKTLVWVGFDVLMH